MESNIHQMREPKLADILTKGEVKPQTRVRKKHSSKIPSNSAQVSIERPKEMRRNNSLMFPQKQTLSTKKFNGINIRIESRQKSLKGDSDRDACDRRPKTKTSTIDNLEAALNPIRTPKYTKESTVNDAESNKIELPQGIKDSPVIKRRVRTLFSVNNQDQNIYNFDRTMPSTKFEDIRANNLPQKALEVVKLSSRIIKPLQSLKYKPMKVKKIIRTTSVRLLDRFKKSKVFDLTHPKPSEILLKQ